MIAAAVIGGTSFAGGIGTIPGAVLGAVVMQSLRSGMVLLKVDSPSRTSSSASCSSTAVGLDAVLRRRASDGWPNSLSLASPSRDAVIQPAAPDRRRLAR